jgi:hypothetical protein
VLVSPVQQNYRAVGLCDRRPVAIEKLRSIARLKMKFLHAAHRDTLKRIRQYAGQPPQTAMKQRWDRRFRLSRWG